MSSKVDCHFFLTSSCRNGDQCPFRHSEAAKGTEEVCSDYAQTGQCPASDCGKRHTEVSSRSTKPPSEVACRNEENGGTCTRSGCIFKHVRATQPGGLNVAAKAFVPQGRPGRPVRPATKEWTAAGKASMEWTPAGNASMEWTPAGKAARPPVKQHANMEWTPATAARPPPIPGTTGIRPPAGQRVVGRPRVATARPQRPPPSVASSDDSQGMDVDVPAQPAIRYAENPTVKASPPGVASIPTIYDILGIAEQAPASADRFARNRRANNRARSSTVSHVPAVSFAPMPGVSVTTQAPKVSVWPQTQAPSVSVSILPADVPSVEPALSLVTHTVGDVADTTPNLNVSPAPVTSNPREVAASSNDNPLRAMVSLDEVELSADEGDGAADTSPAVLQTATTSPPAPPSMPVVVVPEAKIGVSHRTPAKSRTVPPPRDTKTSSPRLGTTDSVGAESSVPKILSFQEIMERKRRKQAEIEASNVVSPPLAPPVVAAAVEPVVEPAVKIAVEPTVETVVEPAVETKPTPVGAKTLMGKRRIVIDEDDVESDASEGKRARPEPPTQHKALAIPNYVAMFEQELADLTCDLEGPLENMPAGDLVSRATLANTFVDQDINQLLGL
ncbi:hypothetical protein H4R27_000007 [Coemansia aciculifera]|nr:hypothetical protein H4R27_000007 [Coemansia aciculifera]